MLALNATNNFTLKDLSAGKIQRNLTKTPACISPILTLSPFDIQNSPKYVSIEHINKINSIYYLKKLEHEYDEFLEKKCQILMLLNFIDDIFDIRDALIIRCSALKRKESQRIMSLNDMDVVQEQNI